MRFIASPRQLLLRRLKRLLLVLYLLHPCSRRQLLPALLSHRDVVNVENAWSSFLPTSCIFAVVKRLLLVGTSYRAGHC